MLLKIMAVANILVWIVCHFFIKDKADDMEDENSETGITHVDSKTSVKEFVLCLLCLCYIIIAPVLLIIGCYYN